MASPTQPCTFHGRHDSSPSMLVSISPWGCISSIWTPLGPFVVGIPLFLPETRAVPLTVTTFFGLIPWHSIIFPLRKSTVASSHPQSGQLSHREGQTEHAATVSAGSILTLGPGGDEGQACGSLQDLAPRLRLPIVRFRTTVPMPFGYNGRETTTSDPNFCSCVYLVLCLALPSSG